MYANYITSIIYLEIRSRRAAHAQEEVKRKRKSFIIEFRMEYKRRKRDIAKTTKEYKYTI
jgi:hypothetical protein